MNNRLSFTKVVLPILFTAIFFSFGYTWQVHTLALEQDQQVKEEVKEQATEIKKDLTDRINRMEDRITEALQQIQIELLRSTGGGLPTP